MKKNSRLKLHYLQHKFVEQFKPIVIQPLIDVEKGNSFFALFYHFEPVKQLKTKQNNNNNNNNLKSNDNKNDHSNDENNSKTSQDRNENYQSTQNSTNPANVNQKHNFDDRSESSQNVVLNNENDELNYYDIDENDIQTLWNVTFSLLYESEASYERLTPHRINRFASFLYRSFNYRSFHRTIDINHLEYHNCNIYDLSQNKELTIYSHDYSHNQTWSKGNKKLNFLYFYSLVHHYTLTWTCKTQYNNNKINSRLSNSCDQNKNLNGDNELQIDSIDNETIDRTHGTFNTSLNSIEIRLTHKRSVAEATLNRLTAHKSPLSNNDNDDDKKCQWKSKICKWKKISSTDNSDSPDNEPMIVADEIIHGKSSSTHTSINQNNNNNANNNSSISCPFPDSCDYSCSVCHKTFRPLIYINTSNHLCSPIDNNPHLTKLKHSEYPLFRGDRSVAEAFARYCHSEQTIKRKFILYDIIPTVILGKKNIQLNINKEYSTIEPKILFKPVTEETCKF